MAFARSDLSMTESAVSPLPESGLSEDIHFTPAGKVTLPKGEVLYKTLATAKAKYERLVEWGDSRPSRPVGAHSVPRRES